jgi:hypothetical protein
VTEGAWHHESEHQELNNEDWDYEGANNNLKLPSKIRKELKNPIVRRINEAKSKYFKDSTMLYLINEED